jgi:DNA mismatch repair ATPase MutS
MRQCGVPVPNLQIWLAKLVALGYGLDQTLLRGGLSTTSTLTIVHRHKVVIVDETETSVGAKVRQRQGDGNWKKAVAKSRTDGLVDRQVKQVLTAGTIVDEGLMNDHRANYILSIKEDIIPGNLYRVCVRGCVCVSWSWADAACLDLQTRRAEPRR